MLEFFAYLYIDLKSKAMSMKVESVLFGIRLPRFQLGLSDFLLCKKGMIDKYLIGFLQELNVLT